MTAIDEVTPNAPNLTAANPRPPIPSPAGTANAGRRSPSERTNRRRLAVSISAVAALAAVVFGIRAFDAPSSGRVGPLPIATSASTSAVQTTELPTTTIENAETVSEPRVVDIADAQRILPAIDLSTTAALGISVGSDGLNVTSAPGLPTSESPVGNDICLVVSTLDVPTGQTCASATDVGGLLLFTQEWTGGNAVVALTAVGVVTSIEDCEGEVAFASNAVATLTMCPTLRPGTTLAVVEVQSGSGERLRVSG